LLFFSSCAGPITHEDDEKIPAVEGVANWFLTHERFSFKDQMGNTVVHPFFDLVPFTHSSDNSVNYFLVTKEGSEYAYDFDLVSGRAFKKFPYCPQSDVWNNFKSTIDRPPFSIGIVPRLLDQSNLPQKIIIYGVLDQAEKINDRAEVDVDKLKEDVGVESHRARVVGGVVEQYCERYPCSHYNSWVSRLVLVAVDANNSKYKDVQTFAQLRKKVDWEYAIAFLQNGEGRAIYTESVKDDKPTYRIINKIEAKQALEFSRQKGHLYQFSELQTLRSGCEKIYDYVWDQLDSFLTQKKDRKFKQFIDFFLDFNKNYLPQYRLCYKNVRATNINESVTRHWSVTMFELFYRLDEKGYEYSCQTGAWHEALGTKKISYERCSNEKILRAFDVSTNLISGLAKGDRPYSRYIEYDFGIGGTKEKIYSWVMVNNKKLRCSNWDKKNEELSSFPTDITWPLSGIEDKLKKDKIVE